MRSCYQHTCSSRHGSHGGLHNDLAPHYTVVQSQKAVSAHFTSKQMLPFGFAERYKCCYTCHSNVRKQLYYSVSKFFVTMNSI